MLTFHNCYFSFFEWCWWRPNSFDPGAMWAVGRCEALYKSRRAFAVFRAECRPVLLWSALGSESWEVCLEPWAALRNSTFDLWSVALCSSLAMLCDPKLFDSGKKLQCLAFESDSRAESLKLNRECDHWYVLLPTAVWDLVNLGVHGPWANFSWHARLELYLPWSLLK